MKRKPYRFLLYLLARIVGWILYAIPLKIGVPIGGLLGRFAFYVVVKERDKTLNHLKIAFGGEKTERE